MIIEFLQPHALNLDEDFEFVETYCNKADINVPNYRLKLRGVSTGKEILLGLFERLGPEHAHYILFAIDDFKQVSPTNIKQQHYSYHLLDSDIVKVEDFFKLWKGSDPMVHLGNYTHSFISRISNYKGSYRFNNTTY
jgi:hypothetical protein